jgi:dTDP-4-dehydrorhamnose reductase
MRAFIAGAGGMLGEALHKVLKSKNKLFCTDIDVNEPWLKYGDFRDFGEYERMVSAFKPDILMHVGAYTDLEYCERHPEETYRTNTLSVEHAATIANAHGIPLVYISTAGIFDGSKEVFDDWDKPNPLGVYARSKYQGELVVQTRVAKHFIFRAGWMMGGGPAKDKKFINKLVKQLETGVDKIHVVDDLFGTPTYTVDFARNLEAMINTPYYGLYNMVCGGETSRLEVAQELVKLLNLENKVAVIPVSSGYFATEYFAPRPPSERLVNYRLNLRGMNLMQDWRAGLKDYLANYFADHVKSFAPDYRP